MMKKTMIIGMLALSITACTPKEPVRSIGDVGGGGMTGGDAVDDIPAVKPIQIPPLKGDLGVKAAPLPPLTGTDFESQQRDAVATDRLYNEIAVRLNSVIDVYNCVREAVNNKSNTIEECLKK